MRAGGDPSLLSRSLASMVAGTQARIPVLREGLPETPNPVNNAGDLKFPKRPGFIPDITLRNFDSPVKILDAITLPKALVGTPMINPSDYPNDATGRYLEDLQMQTMPQGQLMGPPTIQPDPALKDAEAMGGDPVTPIHRDVLEAGLKVKGSERWELLTELVNDPTFRAMSPSDRSLVVREALLDLAGNGIGKDVSELANFSTISPEERQNIVQILRELGAR